MSLLILRNLLKTFGGLVAMNSLTFSVDEASIVGLIGPNGAGKTTTFNIITGNYRPDSGEVIFDRKDITGRPTSTPTLRGTLPTATSACWRSRGRWPRNRASSSSTSRPGA